MPTYPSILTFSTLVALANLVVGGPVPGNANTNAPTVRRGGDYDYDSRPSSYNKYDPKEKYGGKEEVVRYEPMSEPKHGYNNYEPESDCESEDEEFGKRNLLKRFLNDVKPNSKYEEEGEEGYKSDYETENYGYEEEKYESKKYQKTPEYKEEGILNRREGPKNARSRNTRHRHISSKRPSNEPNSSKSGDVGATSDLSLIETDVGAEVLPRTYEENRYDASYDFDSSRKIYTREHKTDKYGKNHVKGKGHSRNSSSSSRSAPSSSRNAFHVFGDNTLIEDDGLANAGEPSDLVDILTDLDIARRGEEYTPKNRYYSRSGDDDRHSSYDSDEEGDEEGDEGKGRKYGKSRGPIRWSGSEGGQNSQKHHEDQDSPDVHSGQDSQQIQGGQNHQQFQGGDQGDTLLDVDVVSNILSQFSGVVGKRGYRVEEPENKKPAYEEPRVEYATSEPHYQEHKAEYMAPELAYAEPKVQYKAPEPTYLEPKVEYKDPEPSYSTEAVYAPTTSSHYTPPIPTSYKIYDPVTKNATSIHIPEPTQYYRAVDTPLYKRGYIQRPFTNHTENDYAPKVKKLAYKSTTLEYKTKPTTRSTKAYEPETTSAAYKAYAPTVTSYDPPKETEEYKQRNTTAPSYASDPTTTAKGAYKPYEATAKPYTS
jgi:hypothetical protein